MKEQDRIFEFSVIMAVYNVERFLREAVDSLVHQTIGFDKIQLILVDDGSTDGSSAICDEYAAKYPENVIVIHKENGGVSSARNAGLPYIMGKYVNFMDSDDRIDYNTFDAVSRFFALHGNETDVAAIPMYFFDADQGPHPQNIKFDLPGDVLSLQDNPYITNLSASASFVKTQSVKDLSFDTRLTSMEDAKYILQVLLDKLTLGLVRGCNYYYRKRSSGEESAVQSCRQNQGWYMPALRFFSNWALDYSEKRFGYIHKFVQHTVMYDLKWKLMQPTIPTGVLTGEEKTEYRKLLYEIACRIDEDVILRQNSMDMDYMLVLLGLKRRQPNAAEWPNGEQLLAEMSTNIDYMRIENGNLCIEGSQAWFEGAVEGPGLAAIVGGNRVYDAIPVRYTSHVVSVEQNIAQKYAFYMEIPLSEFKGRIPVHISFLCRYGCHSISMRKLKTTRYAPVSIELEKSYYVKDGYLITPAEDGFDLRWAGKFHWFGEVRRELAFLKELSHIKDNAAKKAIYCRLLYHAIRPFAPKDIWLVMDRADRGDDNGEAFFRYLVNRKDARCHPVFAVGRNTPDYARLKKIGHVVPYLSWKHKLLHLLARHTISAYSHGEIRSPFFNYSKYYGDLLQRNRVVFLQHGIIKDDLSSGLNRPGSNFSLFITSVEAEHRSVLDGNYGYRDDQVALTGLPRYDLLYEDTKKIITVMPTWSQELCGKFIPEQSKWELLPGFEDSAYYRSYTGFLNDQRLHTAAERLGYTLQFLPHPVLLPHVERFKLDPRVKVLHTNACYRDVFAESALITTDYSSVAFDFAYLGKPVVYTQFTPLHYERGYFDYERDGFGEVERTVEGAVNRLIEYMENDCRMKPEYRERTERFFKYHDHNNCQRVYDAILAMDARDK